MKIIDDIRNETTALRAALEAQTPGCTASVAKADGRNIDELFAEQATLKNLQATLAIRGRASAVLERYQPPSATQARVALAAGDRRPAQEINRANDISKLEKLLATTTPGSATHRCLSQKLAALKAVVVAGVMFFVAAATQAQYPGVYSVGQWNGDGTNSVILAGGTSATNTFACSEYASAKLQISCKATDTTTGAAIVRTYRSLDSTTYETTATTNLVTLDGTNPVSCIIALTNLQNVGVVKVCIDNTNETAIITNLVARVRFNAPSVRLKN